MRVEPPFSDLEWWSAWLDYRLPHYDQAERLAQGTLRGSRTAVIRVGWNGSSAEEAEWHVTLFTLASETPSPTATVEAVRTIKPIGMVLHHVLCDALPDDAATPVDLRAARLSSDVWDLAVASSRHSAAAGDDRMPARQLESSKARLQATARGLQTEIEAVISDGLRLRLGMFLKPPAIIEPEMLLDWVSYRYLLNVRGILQKESGIGQIVWRPRSLAVCQSCTAVFSPKRRNTADFCALCSKRPAVSSVVGEVPIDRGSPQTVRIPELAGNVVVGWRTATVGICERCGSAYHSRRFTTACARCRPAIRQQRHRGRREGHLQR